MPCDVRQTHNHWNIKEVPIWIIFKNGKGGLKILLCSNAVFTYSEIYEKVAQNQNTTLKCVESAIRNASTYAFKNCNDNYKSLFFKDNEIAKPTNAKFLSILAEEIKVNLLN